jgi:Uma2 family endonuclease
VSIITKRLTVDQYEAMVENGILPETNRFELINGRIREKDMKGPLHRVAVQRTLQAIVPLLPAGWHAAKEEAVRIPNRRSEPEPDVSVVRGSIDDYTDHHPEAADVALVVEVTRTSAAKDRKLARVYGPAGIPVYWIVNVPKRRLEVYSNPAGGVYAAPVWLGESDTVELVIVGVTVGRIAVADLLPRAKP